MTEVVSSCLRFTAVGAGVGLGVGLVCTAVRRRNTTDEAMTDGNGDVLRAARYAPLRHMPDLYVAVVALAAYRGGDNASTFDRMCDALTRLCALNAVVLKTTSSETAKITWPRVAKRYASEAVDALRRMRADNVEPDVAKRQEFDEKLAALQTHISNIEYNIAMHTASLFDG